MISISKGTKRQNKSNPEVALFLIFSHLVSGDNETIIEVTVIFNSVFITAHRIFISDL